MKTNRLFVFWFYCLLTIFMLPVLIYGQEEETTLVYGKRYLDINLRAQEKHNRRVAKQQCHILKRLGRKEKQYAANLQRKDSVSYARYLQQPLNFDSIETLSKTDPLPPKHGSSYSVGSGFDTLKRIERYLQEKIHLQDDKASDLNGYTDKIGSVNAESNKRAYINDLIGQRTQNLKAINSGSKANVRGFNSIEKTVFYAKGKMNVFKQMKDEPSKAEEKALEYLQGQLGFDKYLQSSDGMQGKNISSADLEKMGFQTKQQMTANLQKKFGGNLSGLQEKMGGQVKQFQDNLNKVKSTKNTIKQSRRSLKQATNLNKPSFKINPMRGLPFSKRIERQYNYQTTRATIDGKPAMLQLSAMAGFRHTTKLTYGVGIATSIGLGQNWNNIRFSFEGLGLRSFVSWQWLYGIGAYAGYERMYRKAVFINKGSESIPAVELNPHNTKTYTDAILIGLTKSYRINEKWNGSIQVLYDVWWKEKGLRSPVQLRFATMKN